jgi:tetratricopeptide (TPR) repeat protein
MANPISQGGRAAVAEDPVAAAAIRRYEERLMRDPSSLAFAPLADAYRKVGRTREAINLCREGLARFQHYTTARLILAKAHLDDGNPEAALAELGVILMASPRDVQAHRMAAEIHRKVGRWEEARQHLERVVKLDSTDREARLLLEGLAAEGRTEAASPLSRVLADDTFVTASMGTLCLQQGLIDDATLIFLRLSRKHPGDMEARARLDEALRAKTQRRKGT